jgi:hypothetical protein
VNNTDFIQDHILKKLDLYVIDVIINDNKIFKFFVRNSNLKYGKPLEYKHCDAEFLGKYHHQILHKKIFFLSYSNFTSINDSYEKYNYLLLNLKENYSHTITTKCKISNIFLDLTVKGLKSDFIILYIYNKKEQTALLKKFNFNKFIKNEKIWNYTKIINMKNLSILNEIYEYNSFYEVDNSRFILMNSKSLFLFEKYRDYSLLIDSYDISFLVVPFALKFTNLSLISSEFFIYHVKFGFRDNQVNCFSLVKDITLNVNNYKYKELLQTLKILIYFNIEIMMIPFEELRDYLKNVFEEYDLFSYVQNLYSYLNPENIYLFLSFNLNNHKLYVILIFCLIFDKIDLIKKIFDMIMLCERNEETFKDLIEGNYDNDFENDNKYQFYSYVILFRDFITVFFKDFDNLEVARLKNKIFSNIIN